MMMMMTIKGMKNTDYLWKVKAYCKVKRLREKWDSIVKEEMKDELSIDE